MPVVTSAQVKVTVASELFQPAAFGAGVTVPMMVGAHPCTPKICRLKLSPSLPRNSTDN